MTKLRRLIAMSSEERGALVRATVVLVVAKAALAVLGFGRVKKILSRAARPARPLAHARGDSRAMRTAARHLPIRATCLDQAVALWWLVGGELRIGVRRGAGLEAHAWVELDGEVLLDPEAERFAAFDAPLLAGNAAVPAAGPPPSRRPASGPRDAGGPAGETPAVLFRE